MKSSSAAVLATGCLLVGALIGGYNPPSLTPQATMRTQYPGEEKIATAACRRQNQKVMYWWLEDPRKGGAMMHVRCTGQVRIDEEVKF